MKHFFTHKNRKLSCMPEKYFQKNNVFFSLTLALLWVVFSGFSLTTQGKAKDKNEPVLDFVYENFDNVNTAEEALPLYWTATSTHAFPYTFRVFDTHGVGNTQRLTSTMGNTGQVSSWTSPQVTLQNDAVLSFMYRVVQAADYPATATPDIFFSMNILISIDGGLTWQSLEVIGENNHVVSNQYVRKQIDISGYIGQTVKIKAEVSRLGSVFIVDFDDVILGSFSSVEFTTLNSQSQPVAGATIAINGFGSLTTDAAGKASTILPDGTFSYNISATHYYPLSNGSFTLSGADLILPAIQLIGNFPLTFTVTDQDAQALSGVTINYEGTALGYEGEEAVQGSVVTNTSGSATLAMREGSYTYTGRKTDYYNTPGSYTMGIASQQENLTMQIHPLVTFTIEDEASLPIENATISIAGIGQITTNVAGEAFKRLPVFDYNYSAYKIGYLENTASFSVTSNTDLILPTTVLTVAPPTLSFITDVSQGLHFRKTLTGETSPTDLVIITNIGSGDITIQPSDITLTGVDASAFLLTEVTAPIVLGTGDEATLTLAFAPATPGTKTASLEIQDNTSKQLHTISLEGTAYEAVNLPFYEDFETGTFNNWVVVNGAQTNQWHAGEAAGDAGNTSAMVSFDGGITNAYIRSNASSIVHFYMDFAIPVTDKEVFFTFNWKGNGEAFLDYLRIYNTTTIAQPLAGSLITGQIANLNQQPEWTTFSYLVPEEQKGQTRRFVFTWVNDASDGQQPPAAVDNIYVGSLYTLTTITNPTLAGVVTGAGSYGGGMPVNISATANEGYIFSHWSSTAGTFADATSAETVFTMPAENAEITANFTFPGPAVTDVAATYDGTEHSLAAGVPDGVVVTWYNAETGGEVIPTPVSVDVATITAWATTTENGAESLRTPATLTVSPRPLTVTANNDQTKVYGEVDPVLTYAVTEGTLIVGDELTGALTRAAGEDAGTYEILPGTLTAGTNYDITFTPGVLFTITPRPLTVINALAQGKTYDGTDAAVVTGAELSGIVAGDEADVALANAGTGTFAQAAVGTNITVTTSMTLTGTKAGNYTLTQPDYLQANITAAALEIIANNITKPWGEVYTFAGDEYTTLPETLFAGDAVTSVDLASDGAAAGAVAGTYPITVSNAQGTGLTNYNITYTPGTMTVTEEIQIALTLPDLTVQDKTYDATTNAVVGNYGALSGIDPNYPDVQLVTTGVVAAFASSDAGANIQVTVTGFALTGADAGVYFIEDINTTATINAAPLTIAAEDVSKVYGEADPFLGWALASGELMSGDAITGALARDAGEDVGAYAITQGTLTAGYNYTITFVPATLSITQRPITLTAEDKSKVYGEADPALTWAVTAGLLMDGDAITGALARDAGEAAADYAITQGTLAASDNYTVTFVPGTLTITQRPVTVTADDASKMFGNTDPAFTFSVTEGTLVFDDALTGELTREPGEDAGTYAIQQGTLALSNNYALSFVPGTFTIAPRLITINVDSQTKVYGEADPEFTFLVLDGDLLPGDELTGELTREPGEDVGVYEILLGTLAAGDNYLLNYEGSQLTITVRAIAVSADDQSKPYGEADPLLTYQITQGTLAFDDAFTGELTREAGENVGSYAIQQGTLALSDNYDLTFTNGVLSITQMALTVTADDITKIYGEADPELTWQLTAGELAFDDELTGNLSREAGEDVGVYAIEQGTLTAGDNYVLTFVPGQLTITMKELTIGGSFLASDKEYDGTTEAVIFNNELTLEGVEGADDVELIDVVAEFVSPEPGQNIEVVIVSAALSGADMANYTLTLDGAPTTTANIIVPAYVLTIVTVPAEGGTATGDGSYLEGETASLMATPNTGYEFLRWEDADGVELSTEAAFDFVMPAADVTLTAVFDLENVVQDIANVEVKLFPNPAREYVNITSDIRMERVVITDLSGRAMHSENVDHTTLRINTGHLPSGIYLVNIHTEKGLQVKKLQVQ